MKIIEENEVIEIFKKEYPFGIDSSDINLSKINNDYISKIKNRNK
jgi:hypothetical protein